MTRQNRPIIILLLAPLLFGRPAYLLHQTPIVPLAQTLDLTQSLTAGGTLTIPKGTYAIRQTLEIPANTHITCATGTVLTEEHNQGSFLIATGPGISINNCKFIAHTSPVIVLVAAGAYGLKLERNYLQSTNHAQGILINVPGVHDISIIGNKFDDLDYAILQNVQAGDLTNMDIEDNSFSKIAGDGVELNNPSSDCCGPRLSPSTASKITIRNNQFDIPLPANTNDHHAGFCVGIAGAHDVTVVKNTCKSWYQGIHVEDRSRNILIADNVITTNDPSDFEYQAGIEVIDGRDIDIERNVVKDSLGDGIRIDYDPIHQATGITIIANRMLRCRHIGLYVAGGSVGPIKAEIARNVIQGCKTQVFLAGPLRELSLHDNEMGITEGCPIKFAGDVDRTSISIRHNTATQRATETKRDCSY